jgi:hypothetical protein
MSRWVRSLTPSLTHSFLLSLLHSLTHSLPHSFIHSLTHSLTHSFSHSLLHSLTHSLPHSLNHSLTHKKSESHFCTLNKLFSLTYPTRSLVRILIRCHRSEPPMINCHRSAALNKSHKKRQKGISACADRELNPGLRYGLSTIG